MREINFTLYNTPTTRFYIYKYKYKSNISNKHNTSLTISEFIIRIRISIWIHFGSEHLWKSSEESVVRNYCDFRVCSLASQEVVESFCSQHQVLVYVRKKKKKERWVRNERNGKEREKWKMKKKRETKI